ASLLTLDGIAGGVDGQQVTILASNAQVTLPHYSGSTNINRFWNTATSAPTSILGTLTGKAIYQYDATGYWWLVAHEQGAWVTAPFVASDYTGNGSMTWTVEAGDQFCPPVYRLNGKTLTV